MVAAILGRMNRGSSKEQKLLYADQESLIGGEGFRLSICYGRKDMKVCCLKWQPGQNTSEAERR
jgi:hypothetical protein